ncbi:ribosome small subunit-dependent GTPase A [Xylophilus sp.]|uniref:ribosome small subunit-dependent GTPase A n=1 Tax=Xylophilus sp. TaxID=2653893 RepID=UPI0013BBF017|nr:ribosome small subunit-dependent GTPase A [Xylophilus sp.]KAF1046083.1 MAG: Small ribosomal subunit biogenesis GTPase RsgA [Xylophilus sp.]
MKRKSAHGGGAPAALQEGLVVGSHGRHCVVETPDGQRVICHPRGKKTAAVVGDRVQWLASEDEGTIERVQERRNLFYRQDEIRTKSFAANLDLVLMLVAAEPVFSEMQLARALVAAEDAGIAPLIALNKQDLAAPFAQAWERLAPYRAIGYEVLPLSLSGSRAAAAHAALAERLREKTTLVLGPSGAGKSTLTNLVVPEARAATGEISQALQSGRHTTTTTSWYWVDRASHTALIDSPGFQEFGLHHIAAAHLPDCMPDIRAHAQDCRFYNCTHLHEPGCGVIAAVQAGQISASRYRIYGELYAELSRAPRY